MDGFLNPNKILDELEISPGMAAADFGCGSGGWAIPLAKKLKKGEIAGIVYAIDILEEPLSILQSRAQKENLNIKTIKADLELENSSKLAENSLDIALATNLFFQIKEKQAIIKEIKRTLRRSTGQLLIVDWLKDAPLGPEQGRVSVEDIKDLAKNNGFELKKEFKAGVYHFGLVFLKE